MKNAYAIIGAAILSLIFPFQLKSFDGEDSIIIDARTRSWMFHAPGPNVQPGLPLMIVLHGTNSTPGEIRSLTGFDAVADTANFIVAYPRGLAIGNDVQWNVYVDDLPGHEGMNDPNAQDDIKFMDEMIQHFCNNYGIDPSRVYVTGFSNGAFMCYNLAIQLHNRFAAFAPVAGNIWGDSAFVTQYFTTEYAPVPLMHIHGDADGIVAYPDPDFIPNFDYPISAFSTQNCNSPLYASTDLVPGVKQQVYCDGTDSLGMEVRLMRIVGGTHVWPGVSGFHTAGEIWEFCNDYFIFSSLAPCSTTDITNSDPGPAMYIYPSLADETVNIVFQGEIPPAIKIFNTHGELINLVFGPTSRNINITGFRPGVYFCELTLDGKRIVQKFIKL